MYVAVEVWISRFPNLFKLTFQISKFLGLTLQISRMNLVKQPRDQPGNNSSGILLWKYRYCYGVSVNLLAIVALNAIEIMRLIRTVLVVVVVVVAAFFLVIIIVTIIIVIVILIAIKVRIVIE